MHASLEHTAIFRANVPAPWWKIIRQDLEGGPLLGRGRNSRWQSPLRKMHSCTSNKMIFRIRMHSLFRVEIAPIAFRCTERAAKNCGGGLDCTVVSGADFKSFKKGKGGLVRDFSVGKSFHLHYVANLHISFSGRVLNSLYGQARLLSRINQ